MKIDLERVKNAARHLRKEVSGEMNAAAVPYILKLLAEIHEGFLDSAKRATPDAPLALLVMRDLIEGEKKTNTYQRILPVIIYFAYLHSSAQQTHAILSKGVEIAKANGEWLSYGSMWRKQFICGWSFLRLRTIGVRYLVGGSSPACIAAYERRALVVLNLIYRVTD